MFKILTTAAVLSSALLIGSASAAIFATTTATQVINLGKNCHSTQLTTAGAATLALSAVNGEFSGNLLARTYSVTFQSVCNDQSNDLKVYVDKDGDGVAATLITAAGAIEKCVGAKVGSTPLNIGAGIIVAGSVLPGVVVASNNEQTIRDKYEFAVAQAKQGNLAQAYTCNFKGEVIL